MAIFAGISAPIGGKFIDEYSAKAVMLVGFTCTIVGDLILALVVSKNCNMPLLIICLCILGTGMGLSMGTPLNYLMQTYAPPEETASAQSTLSLVKSIGIAVSPNILINFVSQAGQEMPSKLMAVMPKIKGVNLSNSMGSFDIPKNILDSLQNADVTNITSVMKNLASFMFDKAKPMIEKSFVGHVPSNVNVDTIFNGMKADYLSKVEGARGAIESTFQQTLNNGFANLFIASAIIAAIGFIFALFLNNKEKQSN